tara:strand:- start:573 stop:746 length:174 start_codon:yes stop_codon:yes gene_type:complete
MGHLEIQEIQGRVDTLESLVLLGIQGQRVWMEKRAIADIQGLKDLQEIREWEEYKEI